MITHLRHEAAEPISDCVLAYVLERLLDLRLDEQHLKDRGWTLPRLKEE